MPVTIGTVTSNVTVTSGGNAANEQQLEELTKLIAERLKRQQETGDNDRIPERMSES